MTKTLHRTDGAAAESRDDARDARVAAAAPDADGVFSHRQILTILAGLVLGMFLAALDQTVVSTAIRTIADDLHGYDLQAWATTAFLITSTIATPLYGKLSDLYGRRPFYLFAIAVFVAGSMLCGTATSMYQLAGYRAVQGIGAGGLMSLALAIIADIVPPRERSRYQGYFMAVFGTSSVLGPVIGGALAGQPTLLGISGWRWIFYVNVPFGILAFVVIMRVLHLPHTRRHHRIDWPGALALIVCLVPLLIVAEQGRTWGWGSGRSVACYVIGVVGLVAFLLAERAYGDDALLPLRMFRNRTFAIGGMSSVVLGAGMFGGLLLLPQYLQIVHGSSPTVAGLQLIPLVVGIMAGSIVAGQTISRTGRYRPFPLVGVVLIVAALVGMSLILAADTSVWSLVPFMLLMGVGLGFNFQPVILAVQNAVSPREIGVATSSVTFFRQMGGTLGTAAFLSLLFTRLPVDIGDALRSAARAQPALAGQLRQVGSAAGNLSDTSFISKLPAAIALPVKTGFSNSLDTVFLVAACVVALGFVVLLFLPQLALRTQSGIQASQQPGETGQQPAEQTAHAAGMGAPTSTAPPAATETSGAGTEAVATRDIDADTTALDAGDAEVGTATPPPMAADRNGHAPSRPVPDLPSAPAPVPASADRLAVFGRVTGPDGGPLVGATLTLTDLAGRQLARAHADDRGAYSLVAPSGGAFLLVCASELYQPTASMVTIAGTAVEHPVTLAAATRLRGHVSDHGQRLPLAEAFVTLIDVQGQVVSSAITGHDGSYLLDDLLAGTYTLTATADRHLPRSLAVTLPGSSTVTLDVPLLGSGQLTGTVRVAATGQSLPGAMVTVIDNAGAVVAHGLTGPTGGYHFHDLAPGSYTVTSSGYAPTASHAQVAGGRIATTDLALGQHDLGRADEPGVELAQHT